MPLWPAIQGRHDQPPLTPDKAYDWRGAQTHALITTIWYPAASDAVERPLDIPGLSSIFNLGRVAQNPEISESKPKFPLIALSHGTGGSGLSMAWLAEGLAAKGYIVAAVNHPGNNGAEPYTARGFSTWWERARDLSVTIDSMLADSQFGSHIDHGRIGAAGFSLGGYSMIEIAGGITDPQAFAAFCASPQADNICKSPPEFPTLIEDYKKLSSSDPDFQAALRRASDSYRDPRIRAVFAMAPALGPAFQPMSLRKISIPVRIVAGQSDTNVPIASSAEYFTKYIPLAELTIFPGKVNHYDFLDSCPASGFQNNPILCRDPEGVDRDAVHRQTIALAASFFAKTLD